MRTRCANCGTVYDIHVSSMEFRTPQEVAESGICPNCKSNANDPIRQEAWGQYSANRASTKGGY